MEFNDIIWNHYKTHKRQMPWRDDPNPYFVFISEICLQQTQVSRVMQKFPEIIAKFPTFGALAKAPLEDVLRAWQGLGYNRRGKYLQESAKIISEKYEEYLPDDPDVLVMLPGIGPATAGSMVAFAYNLPTIFIETNIRRVFIHHFFADAEGVADKEIVPLIETYIDRKNPREWYYALMDYGTHLAKKVPNPNRKSKHYAKQSKFEGSDRQIRGRLLREYLRTGHQSNLDIVREQKIWQDLLKEDLVR